ncbi:MAG: tRNA (guanosine(46)-N7)-methyltransferase TrmB [Hyphomicrobiales bacterium]
MTRVEPRHQLYGRRKGHALRAHHARLLESLLPQLRVDPPSIARASTAWLEIGFGGGEHLARQASLHPEVCFIGAEPFVNGVAKLLALIEVRGLRNVRIHDGDARVLLETLPDRALDRIYLLYPDPWPKARHHKRRLVSAASLAEFQRVLKPRGLFLFASDWPDYMSWTLFEVGRHGGFFWLAERPCDWRLPFPDWVETRYEAKAKREGRTPVYLAFERV